MNIGSFIGSILGGVIGSSAIVLFVANLFKERWIERVKATYTTELEKMKGAIESEHKTLQSRLDQGLYVTKAQYDLELSAYKDLWIAMSELRNRARSILGIDFYDIPGTENNWRQEATARAIRAYTAAHNEAVSVSEKMAPFYEKQIQNASRSTTSASGLLVQELASWATSQAIGDWEKLTARIRLIADDVERIDDLIRQRLINIRPL
jgi:hypothetical protein